MLVEMWEAMQKEAKIVDAEQDGDAVYYLCGRNMAAELLGLEKESAVKLPPVARKALAAGLVGAGGATVGYAAGKPAGKQELVEEQEAEERARRIAVIRQRLLAMMSEGGGY